VLQHGLDVLFNHFGGISMRVSRETTASKWNTHFSQMLFVSELGLQVHFSQKACPRKQLVFSLEFRNRSDRTLTINRVESVPCLARDNKGEIRNISLPAGCPPTFCEYVSLPRNGALVVGEEGRPHRWSDHYYEPPSGISLSARFYYCPFYYYPWTTYFHLPENLTVWMGSTLSNSVILRFARDRIYIENEHRHESEVSMPLLKKGFRFFKCVENKEADPVESSLHLIVHDGRHEHIVKHTTDLEGFVHIQNSREALQLVRFLTGLQTHYFFKNLNYIEVRAQQPNSNELYGVLSQQKWNMLKLRDPQVTRERNSFLIKRTLVAYPPSQELSPIIYRSIERVFLDGKYTHEVEHIVSDCCFTKSTVWDPLPGVQFPWIILPYY